MIRFFRLMIALLVLSVAIPTAHRTSAQEPPQLATALDQLSASLGVPVLPSDLDSYQFVIDRYTDSALGCTLIAGTPIPESILGYTFTFTVDGVNYDIRVSEDGSISFPCDAALLAQPGNPAQATALAANPTACPPAYAGFLRPRLRAGSQARINPAGAPNRLRDQPSANAVQIGTINPGTVIDVLAGPSCETGAQSGAANIVWWQVRTNGQVGWTAEGLPPSSYFLEPYGDSLGDLSLPAERSLINASTLAGLETLATIPLSRAVDVDVAGESVIFGGYGGVAIYTLPGFQAADVLADRAPIEVNATALDAAERIAFGYCDGTVRLFYGVTDTIVPLDTPEQDCISDLDFNDDGDLLAASSGNLYGGGLGSYLTVYGVESGDVVLQRHTDYVVSRVRFGSDNLTLLAWIDDAVHVIDTRTFDEDDETIIELDALNPLGVLEFFPLPPDTGANVPQLLFSEGNLLRLVELENGEEVIQFEIEAALFPSSASFSPDGSLLAVMSQPGEGNPDPDLTPRLTIFDVETGDVLYDAPQLANALAFSPDGTLLMLLEPDVISLLGVE